MVQINVIRKAGEAEGICSFELFKEPSSGGSPKATHQHFAAAPIDRSPDVSFEVARACRDQLVQIPAERTVLEVLDEAGIEIEFSCVRGICGTCITPELKGIPEHRDKFLTIAEQAINNRFTLLAPEPDHRAF
jgi:vanillate O-demethylase ferredoxin subunit